MSTVTLHPYVGAENRSKAGTYNVKIRVTYKRASRKLATNVTVTQDQLTRSLKIKDQRVLDILDDQIRKMRLWASELPALDEGLTVDDVVAYLRRRASDDRPFRLDFPSWCREVTAGYPKGSRANYMSALRSLCGFMGRESFDISEITSSMMRRWEAALRRRLGDRARAVSLYTQAVAHCHKLARLEYNDDETGTPRIRNPFEFYTAPKQQGSAHRDIPLQVVQLMWEEWPTLEGDESFGVGLFLLSFCTMGCNLPDLHAMLPPDRAGVLTYERTKTRDRLEDSGLMRVRVEPQAAMLAAAFPDVTKVRWLGLHVRFKTYQAAGRVANVGLREWCLKHRLTPVTYYQARHTWATTAYAAGIAPDIISDCLCHHTAARRVDDIYIRKDWRIMAEANAAVMRHAGLACTSGPALP